MIHPLGNKWDFDKLIVIVHVVLSTIRLIYGIMQRVNHIVNN